MALLMIRSSSMGRLGIQPHRRDRFFVQDGIEYGARLSPVNGRNPVAIS